MTMADLANGLALTAGLIALGTILRRRSRWLGCERLFWDIFAAGLAGWVAGRVGWNYETLRDVSGFWTDWHPALTLCGSLGPIVALAVRPHEGPRIGRTATVSVDVASYTLLAVFVYTYLFLVPGVGNGGTGRFAVAQIVRTALLLGLLLSALAARRSPWRRTYVIVAAGIGAGIALRAMVPANTAGPHSVSPLYDVAWVAFFGASAIAARLTPASPEREQDEARDRLAGGVSILMAVIPVLLIPLFGYGALRAFGDAAVGYRTLVTGLATVFGIGLLTLRLIVQRSDLQRADSRARLLAAATEQTADLILITKADGTFEHANDAFLRAVGLTRREMALLRFPQPVEPEFAALAPEIAEEVRAHGVWRGTLRRPRREGASFPASSTVVGLHNRHGRMTHLVAVERDVTDELRLRDQLVHSERLSAVGELVAGVAHEINNPLQAIVGCVELMLDERSENGVDRRDLEIVRREAARAGQIVRNLLAFVRRGEPNRLAADLNQIVRQATELREYHLHQRGIELGLDLSPEPVVALVNREEIQQVILNLLLNAERAVESTGRRGTITVRTGSSGRMRTVDVQDDGPGVPEDLRGRIFEPFFTTKDVGEGTGLGLSISHGIAAAHGGMLELEDRGPGACFRLSLPAHGGIAAVPSLPSVEARSCNRALVVDDEEPIRHLLSRLLRRRAFEVTEAATVGEALAAARRERPAVVLCDIRMPNGGGLALYHQLRREDPALVRGFVFVTGDPVTGPAEEARATEAHVLGKPFTASDLDAVLARIVMVGQ
jgi:PAS domain S-box-containing protein